MLGTDQGLDRAMTMVRDVCEEIKTLTEFPTGSTGSRGTVRTPNEEMWPNAFGLPAKTGERLRRLIREANLFVVEIRDHEAGLRDLNLRVMLARARKLYEYQHMKPAPTAHTM